MSKARLVITAVVVEGRRVRDVAAEYGVSRSWIYELVARYRAEGDAAFEPRSRRPHRSPTRLPDDTVELIIYTHDQLRTAGLDAGPATVVWHLAHRHNITVSAASAHRYLRAANRVRSTPNKKPKSAYHRFEADLPNECWQADMTHVRLLNGDDVEVLSWIDDHSRYALSITAHQRVTSTIVVDTFTRTCADQGTPYSTLTDNGMYFTTRHAGGKGGRNAFETTLAELGVVQKNSRPNHPTTCGKVERFQQTLKKWLRRQPQPTTLDQLQTLIDDFVNDYNHHRPHSSLRPRQPPAHAYHARPKAAPAGNTHTHWRTRHDRIDTAGKVSLRHAGQLYKIGIGRAWQHAPVIMLIADLYIRIIHANTGEVLRTLTLDPTRRYQPTGKPRNPPGKRRNPNP